MENTSFNTTQDQSTWSCVAPDAQQPIQQKYLYYSGAIVIPLTVVLGFWSFVSNAAVIAVVLRGGTLVRPGLLILCSLTLTDFLLGGTFVGFGMEKLIVGDLCLTVQHLLSSYWFIPVIITNIATINNLAVLTVDRYIAVAKPMQYKFLITRGRALTTCCLVWLFSISIGSQRNLGLIPYEVFKLVASLLTLLSGIVIIAFQLQTIRILRHHNNAVAAVTAETNQVNPAMTAANAATERELTVTISYVVAVLSLTCIFPAVVLMISHIFDLPIYNFTFQFSLFCVIWSSSINPLLYYRGNSQIRKGIVKLFKCR